MIFSCVKSCLLCNADLNGLEFSAKTSNYKDIFRTSSVDMIDNLDDETDSCHTRMQIFVSLNFL